MNKLEQQSLEMALKAFNLTTLPKETDTELFRDGLALVIFKNGVKRYAHCIFYEEGTENKVKFKKLFTCENDIASQVVAIDKLYNFAEVNKVKKIKKDEK